MILTKHNRKKAERFFSDVIKIGLDFKLQDAVTVERLTEMGGKKLIKELPEKGQSENDIFE